MDGMDIKMKEVLSLTFTTVKYNIRDNFGKDISAENLRPSRFRMVKIKTAFFMVDSWINRHMVHTLPHQSSWTLENMDNRNSAKLLLLELHSSLFLKTPEHVPFTQKAVEMTHQIQ